MLSAKAQYSLGDANRYFKEHLCVGDYYSEERQVLGQWFGKGPEDLGLSGATRSDEFLRLCENLHPQTGERLTLRQSRDSLRGLTARRASAPNAAENLAEKAVTWAEEHLFERRSVVQEHV